MRLADRLRAALLRWNRLGLAGVLALPLVVSSVLGFLWLHERGLLLWFALGSAALFAVVRGATALARWRAAHNGDGAVRTLPGPTPDPGWSAAETAAFDRARARIETRLGEAMPWQDLPTEALAVVEAVAADLSGGRRSALDFTVPEALLLVDRVALQYRTFLLRHVPWSDRVSVRTMHWLWRKQDTALTAWETGFLAWRGIRLVINPATALMREAERILATGLQDRLTDRFRRDAQVILLEEAAQAAIDLYSGRLRASDAELAQLAARDAARDPAVDEAALRVIVVGQKGVGKSALVEALSGKDAVSGADTLRSEGHDWSLDGADLRLIDTPGLGGGDGRDLPALATAMAGSDLVLWVHRANRPGRAPDAALAAAFRSALDPARHAPPVVAVATGVDLLLPGWPRPEHALTADDHRRLDAAMAAISVAVPGPTPIPVSATAPVWNIEAVTQALATVLPAARRARRERLGAEAARVVGLRGNLDRARRGLGALARTIGARLRR